MSHPSTLLKAALLPLAMWVSHPAAADSVSDFYQGKTVTVYVGYSPGGGYDTYARTVARHLGKHIPGKPSVVVKNRPGAGSMLLTNELYNTLPKDGTVLGIVGRGMVMEPLFGTKEAQYKPAEFTWLGSANNEVSVCVAWHKSGIKSVQDMKSKGMIVGGTGPGADTDTFPTVLNNVLGTQLKLVTGYPGGNDVLMAMERGEVDGRCGYSWSSAKSRQGAWLKEGKMVVLMQMSTSKHEDIPDVPFVMDLATTPTDRQVLELVFARQALGRPFLAPPGLPADRAKALQKAFMDTMKDPELLADAAKQNLEIGPISGVEIEKLLVAMYKAPQNIVDAAKFATDDTRKISITKAVIPEESVSGAKITKLEDGNRKVTLVASGKKYKVSVSGSKTKVNVGGKEAKRKALAMDMTCDVTYQGALAKVLNCK